METLGIVGIIATAIVAIVAIISRRGKGDVTFKTPFGEFQTRESRADRPTKRPAKSRA